MQPPPESSFDARRPFTYAAGRAAGLTANELRGPRYRKLITGVYVDAAVEPDPLHTIIAALLVHPAPAFASHSSAGRVYGVPLPPGLAEEHVSVFDRKNRRRRMGVVPHVAPRDAAIARVRGIDVSAPAQLFIELAQQLTLVDLVVVGDHLVRKGKLTPKELVAYCARHGTEAARRAARYVRRDVDSPMETRLRMLIVLAGLPEPVVNFKVYWEDGTVRYRFDLSYPDYKIVVEYDGRQHRDDLAQWDHDVERGEWFDDDGWRHVPVFSWGIYKRPDRTLARVRKVLVARGHPGVPRELAEGWRPHFPVRP
jgi:very-short-patch-repair endonuclease